MNRLLLLCLLLNATGLFGTGLPPCPFKSLHPSNTSIDTLPPVITCPPGDSVTLGGTGVCGVAYNYTVVFSDDQPNPILIQLSGLASGSEFPLGVTVNTFLVTDQVGNTATCSFTVTVQPFIGTLICRDNTEVGLDQNCAATVSATQILEPGAPAGCIDQYLVELDKTPPYGNGPWVPASLGPSDVGKTYMARVRDEYSGNSCWGNIKVVDGIPPALSCQNLTIPCVVLDRSPAYLKDSLGIAAAVPTAPDACGGSPVITFIDTYVAENCTSGLTQTLNRRWQATDQSGNSVTCIQQIKLERVELSDVKIPAEKTLGCANPDLSPEKNGLPYFEYAGRIFTDLCAIAYNYQDSFIQVCPGSQLLQRTWILVDFCDDVDSFAVQNIHIQDQTGPVISCEPAATVVVQASDCKGKIALQNVAIHDNCSSVASLKVVWTANGIPDTLAGVLYGPDSSGVYAGVFDSITDFPVGTALLEYQAIDACGNKGTCNLTLTVADSAAPVAVCFPLIYAQLLPDGSYAINADTLDAASGDACGQQLYYKVRRVVPTPDCLSGDQFDDIAAFCCSDIGDTLDVTLRVYDIAVPDGPVPDDFALDQSDDCIVKVVVLDTLPVSCTAPASVEVLCTDFDPALDVYGAPAYSCAVDSVSYNVDYAQFDTSCTFGLISRIFKVFDKNGASGECAQQIEVNYLQDYYIKFPDDVIVTLCNSTNLYGEPAFLLKGCEDMVVTYTDEVFQVVPDACRKIERTWAIYNRCTYDTAQALINVANPNPVATVNSPANLPGPIVSAPGTTGTWASTVVKINHTDLAPTDYSQFWDLGANGYQYKQIIKIIDVQKPVIEDCPPEDQLVGDTTENDPLLWNQPYWWDAATGLHDIADAPVALSITAGDACTDGALIGTAFLLFLDLDGDSVRETVINSNNLPAPGIVNFNNYNNPNYSGGTPQTFDGRPVPPNDIYRWTLHWSVNNGKRVAAVQWKTAAQQVQSPSNPSGLPGIAPQLPYGNHRILWTVTDGCGNETTCAYDIVVQDGKAPTLTCHDSLALNLLPAGQVSIFYTEAVLHVSDNYTPPTQVVPFPNKLQFSMRRDGTGTGFPLDSAGNPVVFLIYNCNDLGPQLGELWVSDLAGNSASCLFEIVVEDPDCNCGGCDGLTVAGLIETELEAPVNNVSVFLGAGPALDTTQTDAQGIFQFPEALPTGSDYTVTPFKDGDDLNGVSTFDLVLLSKHILGLQPLNSPYKMIAADANHNNSITSFDIVEIRKLILGINDQFPSNTSWRFVDKNFIFPNPDNPFQSPFPEAITRTSVVVDQLDNDFIGIKTGDLNNSVDPDSLLHPDDRNGGTLFFRTEDRGVARDEEFTIRFEADRPVAGYQFTLNLKDLEVVNILPGEGLDAGNFAVFEDALTAAAENGGSAFAVTFRARKAGRLSDMLMMSSRITRAEAYAPAGKNNFSLLDVGLLFRSPAGMTISGVGFELYQNRPNPFRNGTSIGFHLPESSEATLTIFDETGRVLYKQSAYYPRGYHTVILDDMQIKTEAGVLYYQLETPENNAVRKMVKIR